MSRNSTEIALDGNLRMTLVHDDAKPSYLVGVYRRQRPRRQIAGVAIAQSEHAHLVLQPRDDAGSLWIGATKFTVPASAVERIETFFRIRATRAKDIA